MELESQVLPWMERWIIVDDVNPRRGGQGSIKQVRGKTCGRLGALKEMLPDPVDREERRRRMKQEVVGLAKVMGKGVPAIFDSNTGHAREEEELYLVQAWVDGVNLQQYLKRPLSIEGALKFTLSLARIVERCHGSHVLHRDIKPENIIIDPSGELFLVDFGIAWLPPDDREGDHATRAGQELGNRFLRLPEMAAGQPRDDPRSDVTFVVGILFYLLTATYPRTLSFGGNGLPPHRHLREAFPVATRDDPRMLRLTSLFDVGFQFTPNFRFQSAGRLIERLEEILDPMPTESTAVMTTAIERYQEMMREHETAKRHTILMSMREAAVAFEQRIRTLAAAQHIEPIMMAGSPLRENDAWVTTIRFRQITGGTEVMAYQKVQLDGADVICTSRVDGTPCDYYRGPAADSLRLIEEVGRHSGAFFAMVLDAFVRKVASRRSFLKLIE